MTEAATASAQMSRLASKVAAEDLNAQTNRTVRAIVASETVEDRFQSMEHEDEIEALLLELKANQPRLN